MVRFSQTSRSGWLVLLLLAAAGALGWLTGCATVAKVATGAAEATGQIDRDQAESLNRGIDAIDLTFRDITPEQEYYIGRAVTAELFTRYPVYDHEEANRYLNELGQTLAMASDRPETFGGYHFQLLESDEINAFAAPGGLILITTGMLDLCHSEDELAAVLAHEIGHVAAKHGLRAIKNSRLTSALNILAAESARNFGSEDLKQLVDNFEGAISDVTSTLVVNGYSRDLEEEADRIAVAILERVGYDPRALKVMLSEMQKRWQAGGPGFGRTHPAPAERIETISGALAGQPEQDQPEVRRQRFATATAAS
jgi:predicted Zn-dependent protease